MRNMKHQNGFTLVEMAIVLVIFGMVMSTLTLAMRMYMGGQARDRTLEAVEETQTALFLFQIDQGKYPCPADPTLPPTDPNYGVADCSSANLITVIGRDGDNADGDNNPNTGGDPVLIGTVPFNTLLDPDGNPATADAPYDKFKAHHGFDGWGNKLTYAVTRNLTDAVLTPFDHEAGAIYVVDERNNNILDVPGSAHLVIISHGANAKGAWSENGTYIDDCVDLSIVVPGTTTTKIPKDERENCDHEEPAVADAIFLKGIANDRQNDYNDDIVKFVVSNVSDIWAYTNAIFNDNGTPGNPADDFIINQIANTNGGKIGVGIDTPQEQLHLEGDVQAFEFHVDGICDTAGGDCLPPEYIGGDVLDMQCPAGEVVTQIGRPTAADPTPKVVCSNPFPASAFTPCPAGQFLTGISNVTGPICITP